MIKVLIGDIFESKAQTLVNTVNAVGVMGKGIALGFRKRFPEMFEDYARRCQRREVQLTKPYIYRRLTPPHIINFPTKDHWRSVSKLDDIIKGLKYLQAHIADWGVTSLAVPPLGCGEGRLEWSVVGPTLYRHLRDLDISVELYAPFDAARGVTRRILGASGIWPALADHQNGSSSFHVEPGWVALVAIIEQVSKKRYHWPIGHVGFQKIAYFATEKVGIPTGLSYRRGSYGPYAPEVKQILSSLINNGLIVERKLGRMLATDVGPTYADARRGYESFLAQWRTQIARVVDLVVRMDTDDAEIAATVHFAAEPRLREASPGQPTEAEILNYVMQWKIRRRPPLNDVDVALAIRRLNVLGWIDALPSEALPLPEEALIA